MRVAFERVGRKVSDKALDTAAQARGLKNGHELLARIGAAEISARAVVQSIYPDLANLAPQQIDGDRPILGLDADQPFRRANCCQPVPGERIVGITYRGQGVVAHAIDCMVLASLDAESDRWVDLHWAEGKHPAVNTVAVEMTIAHNAGVLGRVCSLIGEQHANINDLRFVDRKPDFFRIFIELDVSDAEHLHRILTILSAESEVAQISRVRDPNREP